MLIFLNAVLAGSLPKNCATAAPLTGASMAYDANAGAKTAILFGGYTDASPPAAPSTTWIWNGSWTAG